MSTPRTIAFALVVLFGVAAAESPKEKRFELISRQDNDSTDMIQQFEVWHDKDSGQEFVCAHGRFGGLNVDAPVSCFPTGRKWGTK